MKVIDKTLHCATLVWQKKKLHHYTLECNQILLFKVFKFSASPLLNFNTNSSCSTSVKTVCFGFLNIFGVGFTKKHCLLSAVDFDGSNWGKPIFFREIRVKISSKARLVCWVDFQLIL